MLNEKELRKDTLKFMFSSLTYLSIIKSIREKHQETIGTTWRMHAVEGQRHRTHWEKAETGEILTAPHTPQLQRRL